MTNQNSEDEIEKLMNEFDSSLGQQDETKDGTEMSDNGEELSKEELQDQFDGEYVASPTGNTQHLVDINNSQTLCRINLHEKEWPQSSEPGPFNPICKECKSAFAGPAKPTSEAGLGSLNELRNWFAERVDINTDKENSALTKAELQLVAEYIQSLEPDNQPTSEPDLPPIEAETREQLEQVIPSEGWVAERRADEILKMYDELRQRGEADKNELLAVADPNAAEYGSTESMWSNMIEDRDTLRALPGVEAPPNGKKTWEYSDKRR